MRLDGHATAFAPPGIDIPPHHAIAVTPTHVYLAGEYTRIGNRSRGGLAEVDRATGALTTRDVSAGGAVLALVLDPQAQTLYAGGLYSQLAGAPRVDLGAIDLRTGQATGWNPGARGRVRSMARGGGVMYIAGDFDQLAGRPRMNAGAVSIATGQATPWRPQLGGGNGGLGTGLALAVGNGVIYAGGSFTFVGGGFHLNVAALDPVTGGLLDWDPLPRVTATSLTAATCMTLRCSMDSSCSAATSGRVGNVPRSGVVVVTPVAP